MVLYSRIIDNRPELGYPHASRNNSQTKEVRHVFNLTPCQIMSNTMAVKNMSRSLVEGGHTPYANHHFRRLRRVERQKMRVFCKKYVDEDSEHLIRNVRVQHGIWSWDDIHLFDPYGPIERFFVSRIGTSLDVALSDLFYKHRADSFKNVWLRHRTRRLVSMAVTRGWWRDFSVDESGIICPPKDAP